MSLRPELFRALADARRLPHGEEDREAWRQAYETVEEVLAALEEEELGGEEPALSVVLGEPVSSPGEPAELPAGPRSQANDISEISIVSTARLIHRREISPVELVQAML